MSAEGYETTSEARARRDAALRRPVATTPPLSPNMDGAVLDLNSWLERDLPKPDPILGHWLTTTSRVLIPGPTGIGKSMFGVALGMRSSAGIPFLRWQAWRPCEVLYVDGEMSRRLTKQRLMDEATRLGTAPAGFHMLNHEDVENFAPLNIPEGRNTIEAAIKRIGTVDLIIFDNIMSLISGDMKEEESWRQTIPWQHSLTKRKIGQLWFHHTGHDEGRSYGTKTREWQMDTIPFLEKVEREDTDVSFKVEFRKARERTPETRGDFADLNVALVNNEWTHSGADGTSKAKPSPTGTKFLEALINVLAGDDAFTYAGRRCATMEAWKAECVTLGLLDRDKGDSARALFSKHRRELITCNRVACNDDRAWIV
jgi:hypothetical protein